MSLLITLEGIDGSGKTTLINNLKKSENKVVIIDRYIDSTLVYQGLEGKLGVGIVQKIAQKTIDLPLPDITFVLDIDPQQAQERLKRRKLATGEIYFVKADQTEEAILTEVQDIIKQVYLPKKEVILPQYVRVVIQNEQGEFLVVKDNAYGAAKILTQVTKYVNDKEKSVNIGQIKVEVYSSHLRKKLAQKYLSANFSQTQKARFILTSYESEAINAGTKAAQIFNLALLVLVVVGLLLYQIAYRPRFRRTKDVQQENKHFEELKNNLEYIKITGTEKKEIEKNDNLVTKNLKKIFPLVAGKTTFATIPNYLLVKALPLPFLLVAETRGVVAKGGYDGYCSSLKQLNNGFAILEKETYSVPKTYLLPPKKANIIFQKVNFAYLETNKKILDNFSFTFQNGKKYIIIGPNGVGKSTLFKLIVKLYQPQQGVIKLNDTELKKLDDLVLREKIIYLPNNPSFFNTSLGDNIVYPEVYQANIHQEKLEQIAQKLEIKEFIDGLPKR
ncbi:7622_t:CDS:2 [Funneliformis geosporum]|nr:7622_t:CDS:2 [Funneliformis geosporum]